MSTFGDPKTFNPITSDAETSREIYRLLFAPLLGDDPNTEEVTTGSRGLVDQLAGMAKTWTFKLRKKSALERRRAAHGG